MVTVLSNSDVERLLSMHEAIAVIEQALARKAVNAFVTPPRHYIANKNGGLVFTVGGDVDQGVIGFRVYSTFPDSDDDQLVVAYDAATGKLRCVVHGDRIGAIRTGALGGIALKYAARENSEILAVIGSGRQAKAQVEAAACVRKLREIRVYSRSSANRELFAKEIAFQLGIKTSPVATPRDAIIGADIVILATDSNQPVFKADLIEPGQHVTTMRLGAGRNDLDPKVAELASPLFTDSPEQLKVYPGGFFLDHKIEEIADLATHTVTGAPVRVSQDQITLYLSSGLAGTEVVVADAVFRKATSEGADS